MIVNGYALSLDCFGDWLITLNRHFEMDNKTSQQCVDTPLILTNKWIIQKQQSPPWKNRVRDAHRTPFIIPKKLKTPQIKTISIFSTWWSSFWSSDIYLWRHFGNFSINLLYWGNYVLWFAIYRRRVLIDNIGSGIRIQGGLLFVVWSTSIVNRYCPVPYTITPRQYCQIAIK